MKKIGIHHIIMLLLSVVLSACAWQTKKFTSSKNTEFIAMLSDPVIRKDFHHLKAIAMEANLYSQNGKFYFAAEDVKKLDAISALLINRLKDEYHLHAASYKIHTFIGKNEYHSCYQYYNSYNEGMVGKSCAAFPQHFASCQLCDNYIKAIRSRKFSVIHAVWWNNEKTIDLVDSFQLKNGDRVYMGLEIAVG